MLDHQRGRRMPQIGWRNMYSKLMVGCSALLLASTASALRAQDVEFTFYGQITQIQPYAQAESHFQAGDPFVLVLDYTPSGPSPAYGYYLSGGTQAVSPRSILNGSIAPYRGLGPPYGDTDFKDPLEYRMYCYAYATLTNDFLSFGMMDQDTGPWGSVTVGSDFPTQWYSDIVNSVPHDADSFPFAASGQLSFNFMNAGGANLSGSITSGVVANHAPEPATLLVFVLGAGLLFRRRHAWSSATSRP
jgi:hypothetical protein